MVDFSVENTMFVSVGAYSNLDERCHSFIATADKFAIPITWISYGEKWRGFNYHKLRLFHALCVEKQKQGFKYAFLMDALDVVFTDDLQTILRKANIVYEPGTLLFNAEFDNHIYPYNDEKFMSALKVQGVHLNTGLIVGELDMFIAVIPSALEIMDGIKRNSPKHGVATYICDDPLTHGMYEDDQLTYQIMSIYHPEHFRLDTQRELLAWTKIFPPKSLSAWRQDPPISGNVGNASIIHSSSTIKKQPNGQRKFDYWVMFNILNNS
jgi:hypothetical protein